MRAAGVAAMVLALLLLSAVAHGYELRLLAAADFYGANGPDGGPLAAAELGLQLHGEVRDLARRVDLHLDFQDREGFQGNPSRRELHQLNVVVRDLWGRLDITAGRFSVPGGFWLFVDGAGVKIRFYKGLSVQLYGGLRAFTNARADANLTADPLLLPLVGGAIAYDHDKVHASVAVTWTRDLIDLPRGIVPDGGSYSLSGSTSGPPLSARSQQPELFIDGQFVVLPHKAWFLAGGLTFGSRYDVTYSSDLALVAAAPAVTVQTLQSFMAYVIAEWRPLKRFRMSYSFAVDRVKIFTDKSPIDNTQPTDPGAFMDHTLKASYRIWHALRLEARYRIRASDTLNHRIELALLGDRLWRGLGVFASLGGTILQSDTERDQIARNSVTVSGGLSFLTAWLNAKAGILYTGQIGDGLGYSSHARVALDAGPSLQLSPFALSAQRFAFVRLFGSYRHFFAGLDTEMGLDAHQVRLLAQIGYGQ